MDPIIPAFDRAPDELLRRLAADLHGGLVP